ncbi:MAG: hypothetical protein ACOH16_01030 [Propionibacteriaceae bacterium]
MFRTAVTRRSLVGFIAAAGLSGCSLNQQAEIARDPYLPTMRKDPLFLWKPDADVVRKESYSFSSEHMAGNDESSIFIRWTFRTAGDSAALYSDAKQVAYEAGYSDYVLGTRQQGGFRIGCIISELRGDTGKPDEKGVQISLRAPY